MAIELHCNHCGKLVRAPDDAGGKHGKCPACHQSVYIPTPSDQLEPLPLAPEDHSAEEAARRARQEAVRLQQALLNERESGPEPAGARARAPVESAAYEPQLDMDTLVIEYAAAMASGDLAQAEQYAGQIKRNPKKAEEVMQRITVDEILPDRLANIPRPVLVGFFKQLRQ